MPSTKGQIPRFHQRMGDALLSPSLSAKASSFVCFWPAVGPDCTRGRFDTRSFSSSSPPQTTQQRLRHPLRPTTLGLPLSTDADKGLVEKRKTRKVGDLEAAGGPQDPRVSWGRGISFILFGRHGTGGPGGRSDPTSVGQSRRIPGRSSTGSA